MDSRDLTPAQLDRLRRAVVVPRNYVYRLLARINKLGFPEGDELRDA